MEVTHHYHYALRQSEVVASDRPMDGPAVRFQLENTRVNLTEWLRRDFHKAFSSINLGPAKIVLSDGSYKPESGMYEIVLSPGPEANSIRYSIYSHGR